MYLGVLDYKDPLYETLLQACPDVAGPLFHVDGTSSRRVYKYTEEKSRAAIIGKFFSLDDPRPERVLRIKGEYDNLNHIRGRGFDAFPNYVVRPMGRDERIGLAVAEEFIPGKNLDHFMKKAIYEGSSTALGGALSRLAKFLRALHSATANYTASDLDFVGSYYQKILDKLFRQTVISGRDRKKYLRLMDRWMELDLIQGARNVIVHGDATPTNFIFTRDGGVAAIDLERMRMCDMVFDVGMVCGEIKHAFLWRTGNRYSAEPFISHFLREYSFLLNGEGDSFAKITLRIPFYMALTELRIARNSWLDWDYRKRLAAEAMRCLRHGLRLQ